MSPNYIACGLMMYITIRNVHKRHNCRALNLFSNTFLGNSAKNRNSHFPQANHKTINTSPYSLTPPRTAIK